MLLFRVVIFLFSLVILIIVVNYQNFDTNLPYAVVIITPFILISIYLLHSLFKFTTRRFTVMDDFFESIKYRDFSRRYNEESGPQDLRELYKGFNKVNELFKRINKEKEIQYLYLQKMLELIDIGILAFDTNTGVVLWLNDSFKRMLNIPSLKNIEFVKNRKPKLYFNIFEKNHANGNTISIENHNNKTKVLISSSIFKIENDVFKLIVLQNIDDTLNQNESEAWKKLLRVMTHEIMNSIAPISSLAETLQGKIQSSIESPQKSPIEIDDFKLSIESIKNRSEGLMKFAKTYRGLNNITKLNTNKVFIKKLFANISNLLQPSLTVKNIELQFLIQTPDPDLQIEIDTHLIEQVLINLILNAIEACKSIKHPKIIISAQKNVEGHSIVKVTDNGKGMTDEIIDKIFIPFFSTRKNGSGIGLSLCKQIMLLHKGKIQINSIEDKGTVISLIFV